MSAPDTISDAAVDKEAAERWLLARGLPAVLRPGALVHRLLPRTAPSLAALAVVAANSIATLALTGQHAVQIAGRPNVTQGVTLALLALVLPAAVLAGWLVSRVRSVHGRRVAAAAALGVIGCGALFGGPTGRILVNFIAFGSLAAGLLVCTATGIGSILGWAARLTATNLRHMVAMLARALPVLLLTFLVFFNGSVWLMASLDSRERLWAGVGFLFLISASFLVSGTLEQVRPLLAASDGLSRLERVNVVFVVVASQLAQLIMVAMSTGLVFLVLGLILVNPPLLDAWTRGGPSDGRLLGMTLPIPDALIGVSIFLSAITFMYLAAKSVTDEVYRTRFVDPVIDEVRITLRTRRAYLGLVSTPTAGGAQ